MRHSGNSKRSRKSIWLVLAIIAVSLFFSRNAIVKTGVDISLQKIFSDASVSYFSVEWKKDGIVIENLYIESEDYHLRVPFVRLSCKFPLLQGYIEPHVFISEPQFLFLNTNSDATSFAVMPLLQSRFVAAKIDVQQGEMHFSDEVPPVYFSCKSGEEKQHVATAVFSSQDDLNPELWIDLKKEKDDFYLSTKLRQTSISRICQLMSFFYPNVRLISTANGDLEFNGEIVLKKDLSISLLNGEADVHDLRFDYSAGGLYLGAESGHFAISYPTQKIEESLPFWKKFLASVSIQEGEFFLTQPLSQKDWGIKGISLSLESLEEEPVFHMEGNLLAQGNEARCILQGKGVVHEDASFWLESNFFLGSEDPFEGFFAFSATESQNYRLEADFSSLQKQHIQLLSEISPVSLPYYKEGTFAGKITSFWTDRELTKLFIEDFQANDLYLQKETTDVIFPHLSGKAEFSSEKDKIHIDNLSLSSQDGSVIFFKGESRRVDELQFLLSLQNDKLEPSIFQGKFLGSEMGLYLEGDIENTKVNLTINSKPFEVLQVFFPNLYPYFKKDFEGHLTLQFVKDHDNLSGTLDLAIEDQNIGTLSFDTKIEEKSYEIASGKFAANFPSPKVPSAILKMVEPDLNLYGSVACKGTFDKKEVSLDLEAESFSLEWKEKLFFFEQVLGKKKWKFVYEKTADSWKVDVPIAKACLKYHDFTFENIEAELKGTIDQKSSLDLFIFKGDVFGLPKAKASNVQTHIQYTNQAWILEDLLATMQVGVSAFTLDIPTFVFSDGRMDGLIKLLSPEEEILQIRGRATLDEDKAIVDLSNDTHFLGIALAVKELEIRKGELAVLDMHPVATQAQMIKAIDLVVKSELASNSIASIEKNLPEGNMRAHLVYKKNIFSFQIDGHNATFGKDVKKTFHASGKKIGNHYEIEKMTLGDLVVQASFMVEDEQVRFSDVTVKNDGFFAKAKGVLDLVGQDCVLEVLSSSWEDPKMDLQLRATGLVTGNMKTEEFRASCALKGDMGEVHISSKGEIPFLYTLKEGLVLPEAQLSFYYKDKSVALCKLERCTGFAQDKGLLVQHIEFSISPSVKLLLTQHDWAKDLVWKGYLEGEGMLEVLGRGIRFQGSLIDSDLSIREVPFVFRGINFAYNQGSLKLSMRALSDKLLFDVDMNAKINEEVKLGVEVKRSGEVLVGNAHYDGGELVWESISGKILGIECRGAQVGRGDQKAFSGEIAFDIDSMQPVLSKELYKQLKKIGLTKGYRLQGDFFPKGKDSVFYGKLLANDFDFLGYVIDSLQADMTMTSSNIDMKNLHIDDSALALHIKEMSLTKENEKWFANAPLVKLQNFKPSSLKNKYEKQEDKPFIIKNAVVADLKGCLDNLESFTGQGKAFFTNLAKQESHFFLPSELLKDLGLDPQVFVPITGECNYLLESGKLYLQDLSHTYSEGKRSEFYLAPNGERSYLDMSGNLFIDVRMKQHVIVKLTEPFILRVRGNLKQPKYSLHRSK